MSLNLAQDCDLTRDSGMYRISTVEGLVLVVLWVGQILWKTVAYGATSAEQVQTSFNSLLGTSRARLV